MYPLSPENSASVFYQQDFYRNGALPPKTIANTVSSFSAPQSPADHDADTLVFLSATVPCFSHLYSILNFFYCIKSMTLNLNTDSSTLISHGSNEEFFLLSPHEFPMTQT